MIVLLFLTDKKMYDRQNDRTFFWLSKKSTIEYKNLILVRSQNDRTFFVIVKKGTIEYNLTFESSQNDRTFLLSKKGMIE
jgi:hypothetical protein